MYEEETSKCWVKNIEPEEGEKTLYSDTSALGKNMYVRERPSLACGTATPEFRKVEKNENPTNDELTNVVLQ